MENQTRYFLVQAIFYLIPASLGWEFLISKKPEKKKNITITVCLIIFLFGTVKSLKPKWNNPEYEQFAMIIKQDPAKLKYVLEVKKEENGKFSINNDYRSLYYAGIYRDKDLEKRVIKEKGTIYFITKENFDEINGRKVNLISSYESKKFLYKFSGNN